MPYTLAQESAIHARNPELLVSAAAGSGKTAVLVERIYTMLREEGYSLDRMLVCTFTHAAAAEMRERLETRLLEAAQEDRAMQRQADLAETAEISTLHSFCQKLIREHFQAVDIDPQAGLCDEATRARLKSAAIEQCLDESFEKALQPEGAAVKAFLRKYSQKEIIQILEELHGFLMSLPHPFQWLSALAGKEYTPADLETGPMAETLLLDCRARLDGALALVEDAQSLCESPLCREKYPPVIAGDRDILERLAATAEESLAALMGALGKVSYARMPSYRLTDEHEIALTEHLKDLRKQYKRLVENIQKALPRDPAQALADLNAMAPALKGLAQMAERMHAIFMEQKSRLNVIDFSDQEHMALAILSQPELQRKIAAKYDAVFVDEYQDTSAIQEAILNRLRRDEQGLCPCTPPGISPLDPSIDRASRSQKVNSLQQRFFYVGDVKQSIYRFRQADPSLFLNKLGSYQADENSHQRKITLNHNFRSRESVLAGVNQVFAHVMQRSVTEIDYDQDAMLYPGLPSLGDELSEIHVVDKADKKGKEWIPEEAALIAQEINRRVGQPKVNREGREEGRWHYRDMVVLLPAAKGVADTLEKALSDAGIPAFSDDPGGSMESPEIRQVLAHLRLLSNGMDDLALLAALRGPLYAMTEAQLAQVRLQRPERSASFLEALVEAATKGDDPDLSARCQAVLRDLEHERFLQQSMPLDEYLWSFLSRSGMYGFYGAQPGGRLRQANLRMLCVMAGEHIRLRGGDLPGFLTAAQAQRSAGSGDGPAVLSPWEDAVRIMTVHKSKGLEFPLVFVMGLGSGLHRAETGNLVMHAKLGVALKYVNERARTKRDTLLMKAIGLRKRAEQKAERARLLYVALTRAREQFIAIGTGPEKLSTAGLRKTAHGGAYSVWDAKSMLEWLCQSVQNTDDIRLSQDGELSSHPLWKTEVQTEFSTDSTFFPHKTPAFRVVFHIDKDKSSLCGDSLPTEDFAAQGQGNTPLPSSRRERLSALLRELREEPVPQEAIIKEETHPDPLAPALDFTHYPWKIGVTALVRSLGKEQATLFQPEDAQEDAENPAIKRLPLTRPPRLLADLPEYPAYLREPEEQTGLLRGVATHKALSLIPLEPLRGNRRALAQAVEKELALLRMDGLLTEEEFQRTQAPALTRFFESPLGQRALTAQEVRREWSFNLKAPELSQSILQGVIDLCFLEKGAWVLVDYKTDRIQSADDLWALYGLQVQLYCRALEAATGLPVAEASLFALSLGENSAKASPFSS